MGCLKSPMEFLRPTAVEEIVAQLNDRRLGKRGRVNLVPTPRKNTHM
jgi:hypothetical protein